MERRSRTRFFIETLLPDITFAAVAVLLVLYYLRLSRCGVNVRDEWSFIIVAQRLVNGDIPFVHDRTPVILSCFFLYPPVRLFYSLTGAYTGVILFVRWFYVAVHAVFSAGIYLSLRRYRWFAIFAAVNYMCFIPNEIYSLYYNSISLMGITAFCLLLFVGKEPGKLRLAAAGLALACAVMALPHLAILYFLWTASVFIVFFLKRRNDGLFSSLPIYAAPKGWAVITAGIVTCALCVLIGLLTRTTLPDLLKALPEFIAYSNYTAQNVFKLSRLYDLLRMTGYIPPFLLLVLFILLAADRQRYRHRSFYMIAASAALAAIYVALYVDYFRGGLFFNGRNLSTNFLAVNMRAAPFYLIGFFAFFLTEKKNWRLFSFLSVCAAFSVLRDLSSNVVVGLGGAGADIAAALLLCELFRKWCSRSAIEETPQTKKQFAALLCVLPVCLALLSESTWKLAGKDYAFIESNASLLRTPLSEELAEGPMKGIRTTMKGKIIYQDTLSDLKPMRETASSVYIAGTTIFGYLYLDLACPADSTVFDLQKTEPFQLPYWEQFPEKVPDCIYISFYDMDSLSANRDSAEQLISIFGSRFTFTTEQGKAGYILKSVQPI